MLKDAQKNDIVFSQQGINILVASSSTLEASAQDTLKLTGKEIAELREALRVSIGNHADKLTNEDLSEFGISMLEATAIVLRAKYTKRKALQLEGNKLIK